MATSKIEKQMQLRAVDVNATVSKNIPAGNNVQVLESAPLADLGWPSTTVAIVFQWANGSNCVGVNANVSNNTVTLTLKNVSSGAVTVTNIRCLAFYYA